MSLKAITANRLIDGIAVWLTPAGRWSESVYDARIAEDTESLAAMEAIAADATKACIVVDALPIDVKLEDGQPIPTKNKERIRALGPTVRLDLGKQADRLGKAA